MENKEAEKILLECGFSSRKAGEHAPDLNQALKKRGLVYKEDNTPKVKKPKDIIEIKDINEVITSSSKNKKNKEE